jgi:hypothetical protein
MKSILKTCLLLILIGFLSGNIDFSYAINNTPEYFIINSNDNDKANGIRTLIKNQKTNEEADFDLITIDRLQFELHKEGKSPSSLVRIVPKGTHLYDFLAYLLESQRKDTM